MKWICIFALLLSSCSAGMSSRCGYDWNGIEICEARFHHIGKPSTFAVYAVEDHKVTELVSAESSSILAPLAAVIGASPF